MTRDIRVQYLPENKAGRDFVIGDLHGMVPTLQTLLERIKFDQQLDRLFSVGDLVDRGDDSPAALALLSQPWFHTVLGNHEDMLLDYLLPEAVQEYHLGGHDHAFLANGGDYWYPENPISENMEARLRQTPLILVVGAGTSSRFHVVHASFVKSIEDEAPRIRFFTDAEIDAGLPWNNTRYIQGYDDVGTVKDGLLWDRTLYYAFQDLRRKNATVSDLFGDNKDLSPTYCGHTPLETPLVIGRHHMIDTGAFRTDDPSAGLSVVEVKTGRILTANYSGVIDYIVRERQVQDYDRNTKSPDFSR